MVMYDYVVSSLYWQVSKWSVSIVFLHFCFYWTQTMIVYFKKRVVCAATLLLSHLGKKNHLYMQNRILCSEFAFICYMWCSHVCWSQRHGIGKVCWICLGQILVSVLARPEATRNIFSMSGPFEIKLIPHKENLFLRGVSTAKFGYFRMSCGFPETNMP